MPKTAAALGLMLVLILGAAIWPFIRTHLEAVAVLDLVANHPVPAAIRSVVAERVSSRDLTLPTSNGAIRARIYTPLGHPNAPAMVILHGVHHLGMDEPRLISFAAAIASCGLRVLTPDLPGIKDYQVSADSIRTIGDASAWMAVQNPNGERRPVGVMGLSFSGGLALLAAANPVYRPSIKFVVAIGSQDEMGRVARYYRTGEDARPGGAPELLPPHEYGALVLEYEHVEDFVPPADVAAIHAVLRAHLYEDAHAEKAAFAALTGVQHAEAMQLLDTTSAMTRGLLAAAESRHAAAMAGVSPHNHLGSLTTPVYLLHGAGDNIIPASETLWMAAELPGTTLQSVLISPVLSHLNLDGAQPGAMDRWRLVHFFALILRAAHTR
ncbi:MAG: alpha/beta hydrolase [Acidobacteriota bacterium]|nr:alpha/beta hydrolase [Acidobacteriota bacterium]